MDTQENSRGTYIGPSPRGEGAPSLPQTPPLASEGSQDLSTAFQFRDVGRYVILVGWCEEGHPATKNSLQLSQG